MNDAQTQAGRWCLILGASSGMGRACAIALAKQGLNVIGVHLDAAERQDEIAGLVEELRGYGVCVRFFNENANNDSSRASIVAEVQEEVRQGRGIRVLVHSLAFGTLLPFLRDGGTGEPLSRRQVDMTLSVMAHSLIYWVQTLSDSRLLTRGGKIFALTSAGSSHATRNYGAVSAAKCALESHVRQLALELAPQQIAVNAIRAGVTITPALQRIPEYEDLVERARRYNPHGRLTTPEDVAEAIALLSSCESSWITGNVIGVDGGEILTT